MDLLRRGEARGGGNLREPSRLCLGIRLNLPLGHMYKREVPLIIERLCTGIYGSDTRLVRFKTHP